METRSEPVPDTMPGRLRGIAATARTAIAAVSRRLLDIALPNLCAACREPVASEGVCASCWPKLSFIAPPFCARLGIPFAYDSGTDLLSMEAIADPPAYARARAAVRYDEIAGSLVHGFKYQDRTDLAPVLGRWMARAGAELLKDADLIVPVPLHWRRRWSRRYNQSGVLATVIGKLSHVAVGGDVLKRIRPTTQQVGLSRTERARNVQGAFQVPDSRKADVKGRRIVLIDDVLTSGATVDACARALLRAGAADVDVLIFARVVESVKNPI